MNNFYRKLRQEVAHLLNKGLKIPKLETGFSMLEAVVVVGVLLALAVGGFLSYGPIVENAKFAQVKSTAAQIYTAATVHNSDGDSSTKPQDVIDTYNASNDQIRVEILPPGTTPLIGAMTTGRAVPTAYEPVPGEDFCVSATNVATPKIHAEFGYCPADPSDGSVAVPSDDPTPTPTPEPTVSESPVPVPVPSPTPTSTTPTVGSPGDKSHLPPSNTTEGYIVLKFDTSAEAQCSTLNLPVTNGVSISANWGDGTTTTARPLEHNYSEQGIRYVVIKGQTTAFGQANWEDAPCLLEVVMWTEATGTKDMSYAFNNTTRLTSVSTIPKTVTTLQATFKNSTFNAPLNWYLPKLITTYEMFKNNKNFNQKIVFSPDALQITASMFEGATAMNSQVVLSGANRGQTLNNISKMFKDATSFNSYLDLGYADLVVDASSVFENATSFNQPITMNLSFTNNARSMFKNATSFNKPVSSMKFGYVASYDQMFMGATSFNQPVSSFTMKAGETHTLNSMFEGATSFNQPLYNWSFSNVRVLNRVFWNTPNFKQNLNAIQIHYSLANTSTDFSDSPDRSWWPTGLAKP